MLGLSASVAADDVCIRCRVRRSPYALNPEYDDEVEMECTLRSWNENVGDGDISGKGVTSQWLSRQQQQPQPYHGNGDQNDETNNANQHEGGPEIIFRPVHSQSSVVVRHGSAGSVTRGGGDTGGGNDGDLSNRRFSHIRTRSASGGRSPIVGRPPVASIDRKNLIPASGDGNGSNPGSRSLSRSRSRLRRSRSLSRSGSRTGSSFAAQGIFDTSGLNDSDINGGTMQGGGNDSIIDSPYNSDGEGGGISAVGGSTGSPGGGSSAIPAPPPLPSYRFHASDIIVVDVVADSEDISPAAERSRRIYLTTISSGYFECSFDSLNSHSVMVAFLKAVLPSERINRKGELKTNTQAFATTMSCCTTDIRETYDMENFTARELKETVERESLFDKLRRRISHILGQCGDLSVQLSDTVCVGQVADANADAQTIDYSTGAFDSTITTPVHNNKPAVQLDDESAVLPDEPKISFEATSSRDSEEVAIDIKDEALNTGNLDATLNLKESSAEQLMFSKKVNEESDGSASAVGLGDDSVNDNAVADICTEESSKVNAPARSPEEAGGGMMQSYDL